MLTQTLMQPNGFYNNTLCMINNQEQRFGYKITIESREFTRKNRAFIAGIFWIIQIMLLEITTPITKQTH